MDKTQFDKVVSQKTNFLINYYSDKNESKAKVTAAALSQFLDSDEFNRAIREGIEMEAEKVNKSFEEMLKLVEEKVKTSSSSSQTSNKRKSSESLTSGKRLNQSFSSQPLFDFDDETISQDLEKLMDSAVDQKGDSSKINTKEMLKDEGENGHKTDKKNEIKDDMKKSD